MSIVFLHLLPETKSSFEYAMEVGYMKDMNYPLAEVVLCCGFFFVYLIEEIIHAWVGHEHSPPEVKVDITGPSTVEEAMKEAKIKRTNRATSLVRFSESQQSVSKNSAIVTIAVLAGPLSYTNDGFEGESIEAKDNEAERHSIHTIPHCHHETPLKKNITVMEAVVVVVALSFHSVMEGLVLGLEESTMDVWVLFAALCSHKIVIAFSMSMELLEIGVALKPFIASMIIFALASPIGGLIGSLIVAYSPAETASGVVVPAVLQAISGGTILYITFCEVLERERSKPEGSQVRFVALVLGFMVMASLESIGEHNHDHHVDTTATTIPCVPTITSMMVST